MTSTHSGHQTGKSVKSSPVDLYDSHYSNLQAELYREIRRETYGEDLGQASWMTAAECTTFCQWLRIRPSMHVLDVACGSGGLSLFIMRQTGARVTGVDVNEPAILAARARAEHDAGGALVTFHIADAARAMPFPATSVDAIFCNDAINHLPDREAVLREWFRLLKPGGRLLYTDPIVVTGSLSQEEIATRSSVGFYLFTPPTENERGIRAAGFTLLRVEDATGAVEAVSRRWYEARAARAELLVPVEGERTFSDLQRFLWTVHKLSHEKRLSRYAFLAEKPGGVASKTGATGDAQRDRTEP